MKLNKTAFVLVIALAVGAVTLLLVQRYITSEVAEKTGGATKAIKTAQVLVAKTELAKGVTVSPDTIAIREVPAEWAHSQAVRPEQFERVEQMKLAYPLRSGEMLMWSALDNPNNAAFSTRVGSGRRALTVPVDEINSMSGLLEPGDVIDLYMVTQGVSTRGVTPIIEGVKVLAAGQRVTTHPDGKASSYSAITLDVAIEEAEILTLARQAGALVAMLRNPQDVERRGVPPNLMALLSGQRATVSASGSGIPIFYGNKPLPASLQGSGGAAGKPEIAALEKFTAAMERLSRGSDSSPSKGAQDASAPGPALGQPFQVIPPPANAVANAS